MAARVESPAGGADDGAAPSIPSAFKNHLKLGATEAIMWIACRRHFPHETIREHLAAVGAPLQMFPALQRRVDKAELQLFRLIIGGVPATGTLDHEGYPDHEKRVPVPVEFLKDGAYIELLSGHLRVDPLLEKHSLYQRPTYHYVDIERDAFFKALAAAEPRNQATDDKPIELADASLAKGQEDAPAQATPTAPSDKKPQRNRKRDVEADAKLRSRIEMVLAVARRKWLDPNKRPEIDVMAKDLERLHRKELGYKFETIRKILKGTYSVSVRLGIPGL